MRGRPVLERAQQETEPTLGVRAGHAENVEHDQLKPGIGNPDGPAPQLTSVVDRVIMQCPNTGPLSGKQSLDILWMRRGEWMVRKRPRAGFRVGLEQWKVVDPRERVPGSR